MGGAGCSQMSADSFVCSSATPPLPSGMCLEKGGTARQQNLHLGWHEVKEMRKQGKICLSPFNFAWDSANFFLFQKKWPSGLTAWTARWSPNWGSSPRRVRIWGRFWDGVPGLPVAIHLDNLTGWLVKEWMSVCRLVAELGPDAINCCCNNGLVDKLTAALVKYLSGRKYLSSPSWKPRGSGRRSFHYHDGKNMK